MFSYTPDIVAVPPDLIKSALNDVQVAPFRALPKYSLHKCNLDLVLFLQTAFSQKFLFGITPKFGVQQILDGQPIHTDLNRVEVYNFILSTGGDDVRTCFWNDYNGSEMLESLRIEPFRWHKLDVTIPHSVQNIKSKRIAISVWV
jgi:hypothetical protein